MIIKCEKCGTRFNFDESVLNKHGSKVRCSVCRHIFLAYPPGLSRHDQEAGVSAIEDEFEKTIALDSPPSYEDILVDTDQGEEEIDRDSSADSLMDESFSPADMGEKTEGGRIGVPAKKMTGKSHLPAVFIVIILILLGAAAAVFFFAPQLIPDSVPFLKKEKKQVMTDSGVRRLTLKAVTGTFVASKEAGQVFVIRGMVGNNYSKSRSFISIKGNILDNKGRVVRTKSIYAGNTFKDEEIEAMPLEKINKALGNRMGTDKKNFNIAPGTYIPFMIVFENLPENLSEFTVEPIRSFPGKG